tara:strand:+ start:115 stop:501 length:387 start_codon:yes stop_codon:yes gene_type:complete
MATAKDISANNKIDIVKDNKVIAKIEQPLTNVIAINSPGPIGPAGPTGPSGFGYPTYTTASFFYSGSNLTQSVVEFTTGNQTTNITYTGSFSSGKVSVVQVTQSDATVKTYTIVYSGSSTVVDKIIQS